MEEFFDEKKDDFAEEAREELNGVEEKVEEYLEGGEPLQQES